MTLARVIDIDVAFLYMKADVKIGLDFTAAMVPCDKDTTGAILYCSVAASVSDGKTYQTTYFACFSEVEVKEALNDLYLKITESVELNKSLQDFKIMCFESYKQRLKKWIKLK